MKTKRKVKKLDLHVETLRYLVKPDLEAAVGGITANKVCNTTACTNTFACSGCQPCA